MNIFQEVAQGFMDALQGIWASSGFLGNDPRNYVMIIIALALLYLAIKKEFEPLLLLPIAFGMLLVNVFPGITANPSTEMQLVTDYMAAHGNVAGNYPIVLLNGQEYYQIPTNGGLFYYLYQGVKLGIYPPLIFLGIGAMTDFGPLIANPKSFLPGRGSSAWYFPHIYRMLWLFWCLYASRKPAANRHYRWRRWPDGNLCHSKFWHLIS